MSVSVFVFGNHLGTFEVEKLMLEIHIGKEESVSENLLRYKKIERFPLWNTRIAPKTAEVKAPRPASYG